MYKRQAEGRARVKRMDTGEAAEVPLNAEGFLKYVYHNMLDAVIDAAPDSMPE